MRRSGDSLASPGSRLSPPVGARGPSPVRSVGPAAARAAAASQSWVSVARQCLPCEDCSGNRGLWKVCGGCELSENEKSGSGVPVSRQTKNQGLGFGQAAKSKIRVWGLGFEQVAKSKIRVWGLGSGGQCLQIVPGGPPPVLEAQCAPFTFVRPSPGAQTQAPGRNARERGTCLCALQPRSSDSKRRKSRGST